MTQDLNQTSSTPTISRRRRAVLPHLGNFFIGNLYHAITGNKRLPKTLFTRAVANGLHREHLEAVYRQAKSPAELPALLLRVGDDRLHKALYWDEIGVKNRARDNYLESSLWDLYASCLISDPAQRSRVIERFRSSYIFASQHFNHPAQALDIPYLSTTLKGYLRLPTQTAAQSGEDGAGYIKLNNPCVIILNGIGSQKEELHIAENSLLAAGMATLSFDYPIGEFDDNGQCAFDFDEEELTNALFMYLSTREEIDASRIALMGLSVGGRIALYAAMRKPERFRAVATLSAPYDMSADIDLLLPVMKREFAAPQNCSKSTILDLARRTALRGELGNLVTSVLVVGGGKDLIAMPEETRAIYDQCGAADKKLMICPSAGHNCNEMMPSLRHEVAQWLRQRL